MLPVATDIALSKLNVNLNGVAVSARRFIDFDHHRLHEFDGHFRTAPPERLHSLIQYYFSSAEKVTADPGNYQRMSVRSNELPRSKIY